MSDSCVLPEFGLVEAAALARKLYGLDGPIRQLDGERDLNFLVGSTGARFVFKIANAGESPAMLECQHLIFERLAAARVFPATVTARESVNGKTIETVHDADGRNHACRVLPYVEGRLLREIENPSLALLAESDGGWPCSTVPWISFHTPPWSVRYCGRWTPRSTSSAATARCSTMRREG